MEDHVGLVRQAGRRVQAFCNPGNHVVGGESGDAVVVIVAGGAGYQVSFVGLQQVRIVLRCSGKEVVAMFGAP